MLGLVYAQITLAVNKKDRFCTEESGGSGITGKDIVMVEVIVNKDLD